MWDAILAYGTMCLAAIVTLATLLKDARDYLKTSEKHGKWLLWSVYLCTVLLFLAGIFQTHATRKQAWEDREQARKDREHLVADRAHAREVEAVNQARLSDANDSLSRLQDEVGRLQTRAETIGLSRELSDVSAELADAKSKLQQPRARFVATFATPYYDKIPVVESVGERTARGVKVNFGVFNAADVAAANGIIALRLCLGCQFGEEPAGFSKPETGPADERIRSFDTIQERAVLQDMTATIIPPLGGPRRFAFAVMVKCRNCEPGRWNQLIVTIPSIGPPDFRQKGNPKKSH